MSDSKKRFDLPVSTRRRDALAVPSSPTLNVRQQPLQAGGGLTEAQMDKVVDGAVNAVGDAFCIAKTLVSGYVEIGKIREQSTADLGKVEAETRKIEAEMAGEVLKMLAHNDGLRTRGEMTVEIIRAINQSLSHIPDVDTGARRALIAGLPTLVELALVTQAGA